MLPRIMTHHGKQQGCEQMHIFTPLKTDVSGAKVRKCNDISNLTENTASFGYTPLLKQHFFYDRVPEHNYEYRLFHR